MNRSRRSAFTLVELLVVITIIGILMGLLIPAVNSARESARRNQCSVNMKNLALAAFQFENTKGYLPRYSEKYGFFPGGPDPTDPTATMPIPAHIKVGGYGVGILPWVDAQPTYEHWTEDRYPILTTGTGEVEESLAVGATNFGNGFHELAGPNLQIFQCPSNPVEDADRGLNSYVSNNGLSYARVTSGGIVTLPNTGTGALTEVPFAEICNRNNTTSTPGYVGHEGPGGSITPYFNTDTKVKLDDLKDGPGYTVLYTENVQAFPWYLPGMVSGPTMSIVQDVGSSSTPKYEWDGSDANVQFAIYTSAYTAGAVWHLEDKDYSETFIGGTHAFNNQYSASVVEVDPKHKINGRGNTVADDLFVNQMDTSNYVDLARPSSAHVEGVNVGFADGATRFVTESIDYRVYQAIMTPRGKSSDVPWPEFVLTDEITL